MIGSYLDKYNFNYLLNQALSHVPDSLDKREGSIIYDALAPACYELAEYYMELKQVLLNSSVSTATGIYLDLKAAEQGLERYQASYAVKRADFLTTANNPAYIPIGARFSIISDLSNLNYQVTGNYLDENGQVVPGAYRLICEEVGTRGNSYVGALIPITYIANLKSVHMTDLLIPARDAETDEELRARFFMNLNNKPFGGNIAQYDNELKSIDGVGEVQIYPVWNGGGTVKLSVIDSEYNAISADFINILQNQIDPAPHGTGLGFAPIGHQVTITTPDIINIDISARVVLDSNYTLAQVTPAIEQAIGDYLKGLRANWGTPNDMNQYSMAVYIARINAAILTVAGVSNVTGTTLNQSESDLFLSQDALTQQIPILGVVALNE